MRNLLKSPRSITAMLFRWRFIYRSCLIFLGVSVLSVFPESLLQAQPLNVDVQVQPLTAIAPVIAVPPGRGSSAIRRTTDDMRRAADDRWERARDSENFVVEVKITNGTDRAYLIKANKVSLRAESGERVRPLEANEESPTPVLTDQTIAPGAEIRGYLSFPPGSYTGARGFLVEERTQANEGFSVDF
jgi:hypothetical protein